MYVLIPREPRYQPRRELIHTYTETVRLDGYVAVVQDPRARDYLVKRRQFRDVTDRMLSRSEVAERLGVIVPNVDRWVEKGKLKGYGSGEDMRFMVEDVAALEQERGKEGAVVSG